MLLEHRLNLSRLDTKTADLDLFVAAPEKFDVAARKVAG
jgi:hypothetical protein